MPRGYSDSTMELMLLNRRSFFAANRRIKRPVRSRGESILTRPLSVVTVFGVVPFAGIPEPGPAGSPASYPKIMGQLRVQRAFQHGLGQLVSQTISAVDRGSLFDRILDQRIQLGR